MLADHGLSRGQPSSDRFDDVRLARAFPDRRMGTWPKLEDGSPTPTNWIFGFDASPTGEMSLPKTEVVLYRLDEIPLPKTEDLRIRTTE